MLSKAIFNLYYMKYVLPEKRKDFITYFYFYLLVSGDKNILRLKIVRLYL